MKELIVDVGPKNVIHVITDNAKNSACAGLLIEGLYPNIIWIPCVVHTLRPCLAKYLRNKEPLKTIKRLVNSVI